MSTSDTKGKNIAVVVICIVMLAIAAIVGWWVKSQRADTQQPESIVNVSSEPENITDQHVDKPEIAASATPEVKQDLHEVVGRWLRSDGSYYIVIKSVDENGNLEAGYFNPNMINVSKAQASLKGSTVNVYVELRDVNYPGSNYKLVYDPSSDRLSGTYFQAVAGETYDVEFGRVK